MAASTIFRGLIIAALTLLLIQLVATWTEPELPEEIATWLDGQNLSSLGAALAHGNLGTQLVVGVLIYGFVFAYVIALLGLLAFQRWARVLFIMLMPLRLALQASLGTTISRPVDTFESAAYLIDGAMLVLLFVEPVRARFRKALPPVEPADTPPPPIPPP